MGRSLGPLLAVSPWACFCVCLLGVGLAPWIPGFQQPPREPRGCHPSLPNPPPCPFATGSRPLPAPNPDRSSKTSGKRSILTDFDRILFLQSPNHSVKRRQSKGLPRKKVWPRRSPRARWTKAKVRGLS